MNRTIATLAAGALGVGAHYLASLSGATGEPILIENFSFCISKKINLGTEAHRVKLLFQCVFYLI